jgi:hypothetical protein
MKQKGIAEFFTSPVDPDYVEKRVAELVGRFGA